MKYQSLIDIAKIVKISEELSIKKRKFLKLSISQKEKGFMIKVKDNSKYKNKSYSTTLIKKFTNYLYGSTENQTVISLPSHQFGEPSALLMHLTHLQSWLAP